MRCPQCSQVASSGATACTGCGAPLQPSLPAGGERPSSAPRSPRSYTPKHLRDDILRSRSAVEGERKQVTVVFCDIAGSTALAERIGPEAMHRVLNEFFGLALPEVHRYEGTVNQFLGDGFMALFGAPLAHEDHARRAALAALALQKKVSEGLESLRGFPDVRFGVRIGINSGPVVVGRIGDDLRMDYTAVGDTTHLAARLEHSAEPGAIYLSQTAHDAAADYVECTALKPKRFKGIGSPVQAYRLVALRSEAEAVAMRKRRRLRSELVGRTEQLARFEERLAALKKGRGSRLALIGPPGAGKSRFIAEMDRRAHGLDVTWVEGRTLSNGETLGYFPFLQIIRDLLGIAELENDERAWSKIVEAVGELFDDQVADVAPYLGRLLGLPGGPYESRLRYLDGEAARRQIFRALRRFLERVAERLPLVIVLEDWHWADQTSREVLEHILPLVDSAPILLCVVSRSDADFPESYLDPGDGVSNAIWLPPLGRAEGALLLRNLLGGELSPGLRDVLLDRADGNPFFLEELVRVLRDLNVLHQDPSTGAFHSSRPVDALPIPVSLHGVIMARIDRLPEEVKHVLKVASVIGRSFFYPILCTLADRDGALDRHLDELVLLELVRKKETKNSREYIFNHALVHEATYESILTERRSELHELVGDCMEIAFAEHLDDFYGLLAFHYAQAQSWQKAQEYLFKAGDQAGRIAADVEALRHYDRALAAYEQVSGPSWDPVERATLHRKMGEALFRRGDHQRALEYLRLALKSLGSPYPTSPWGVRLAIVKELVVQAVHRFSGERKLLTDGQGTDDVRTKEESNIYEALGWITYFVDQELFALGTLRHLNSAERSEVLWGRVSSSMAFGVILDQVPLFTVSRWYHARGMRIARQIQHPVALAFAHFGLGLHEHHAEGNLVEALAHYRDAARAYSESGDFRRWGCSVFFAGWVLRVQGDIAESLRMHEELVRAGEDAGDHHVWGWGLQGKGRTLWQAGHAAEAVPHLEKAIELFESVPDYQLVAGAQGDLGQCYLCLGDLARAGQILDATLATIKKRRFRGPFCTEVYSAQAEASVARLEAATAGDRVLALSRARAACRRALRHGRANPEGLPAAHRLRGTVEWICGNRDRAQKAWQEGMKIAEKLDAKYDLARLCLEIGRRTEMPGYLERFETLKSLMAAQADGGSHESELALSPASDGHPV